MNDEKTNDKNMYDEKTNDKKMNDEKTNDKNMYDEKTNDKKMNYEKTNNEQNYIYYKNMSLIDFLNNGDKSSNDLIYYNLLKKYQLNHYKHINISYIEDKIIDSKLKYNKNDIINDLATNIYASKSTILYKNIKTRNKKWLNSFRFMSDKPTSQLICTSFSIQRKNIKKPTIYAYLYSYKEDNGNYKDYMICTGANLISSDGEYRNKISSIKIIDILMSKYYSLWNEVENYLLSKKKIDLNIDNYYNKSKVSKTLINKINTNIKSKRYDIKLLIMSWITQSYEHYNNISASHIDTNYEKNFFSKNDHIFINYMINKYKDITIKIYIWYSGCLMSLFKINPITYIINHQNQPIYEPFIGQKIIPLTLLEHKNKGNIKYIAWLELYVLFNINDLLINNVSPNFNMTYDWSIIDNINKKLFSNRSMVYKIEQSDKIIELINKSTNKGRFDRFNESKTKIFSNKALLLLIEHTGRTIFNTAKYMKSDIYKEKYINSNIFYTSVSFNKCMFDILYGLYIMNTRKNIIHYDLHLNNVTIRLTDKSFDVSSFKNNKYGYIIDEDIYVLEDTGCIATIIDFSRSMIIPQDVSKFILIKDIMIEKILHVYKTNITGLLDIKELENKLITDFENIYHLFCAYDIYTFSKKLIIFINDNKYIKSHKSNIPLLTKILNISSNYLENLIPRYVSGEIKDISKIINPNLKIIKTLYKNKKNKYKKNIYWSDIYVNNSELKHNLNNLNNLPNFLRHDNNHIFKKDNEIINLTKINMKEQKLIKGAFNIRLLNKIKNNMDIYNNYFINRDNIFT
jgi:hypothetical protein